MKLLEDLFYSCFIYNVQILFQISQFYCCSNFTFVKF